MVKVGRFRSLILGNGEFVLCKDVVDETGESEPKSNAIGQNRRGGRLETRVAEEEVVGIEREFLGRLLEHRAQHLFQAISPGLVHAGVHGVFDAAGVGGGPVHALRVARR